MHDDLSGYAADHLPGLIFPMNTFGQIHKSAAFGVCRQAALNLRVDVAAQCAVGFELRHEYFRKSAADDESVYVGQGLVIHRIHADELDTGRAQSVEVFTVIKTKRLVACNGNAQWARRCLYG